MHYLHLLTALCNISKLFAQGHSVHDAPRLTVEPRPNQLTKESSVHRLPRHRMDSTEDIYRLPPMEIKSFEEWNSGDVEVQSATLDIPDPDYSDDEENNNNEEKDCKNDDEITQDTAEDIKDEEELDNEDEEELDNEDEDSKADFAELNHVQKAEFLQRKLRLLSQEEIQNYSDELESRVEIPDPDYHEDEYCDEQKGNKFVPKFKHTALGRSGSNPVPSGPHLNADGLIEPRKLHNPVLESREHQDLHRELYMNKKMGIDVLHKKPEFQKEVLRRKTQKEKKEEEEKKITFEKKLEEQAHKLRSVS
ncbi:hypothetical protein CAPTEDRAFT_186878 [Capitella teleta]|uniref:Protein LTV1 homolog n=1 Tax=Capitella teleta TaxID=283909 RepID=R7TZW5_CAPTE|nr:hypothetical protein CAPTEDRAFT_186878 [Capitella teleta]|eukprot:ELT96941.1 hypothetical protein CAPTEDRAFT_186878 [Capitella teleta]